MTKTQELQKELEVAKKEERLDYLKKELKLLKEAHEDKAYGSDHFERASRCDSKGATYYEKFFIENDILYVTEWYINSSKRSGYEKPNKFSISYSRDVHKRALSGEEKSHLNEYNPSHNLYSGYSYFRKEISKEKFMTLWEVAEEANTIIKDAFNGKLDIKTEWVTGGDSSNESEMEQGYKDLKIDYIDIEKSKPKLFEVIRYARLPLFQNNKFIPKQFYNQILELQIQKLQKDLQSPWTDGRRANALQHDIDIITKNLL